MRMRTPGTAICGAAGRESRPYRPEVLTYNEIVDTIRTIIGVRRWKIHVPVPLVWPAAWMMERLLARPLITVEQLRLLEGDSVGEVGLVERAFGFHPTSLRDGLAYLQR